MSSTDDIVLNSACFPQINGMRFNGHRWVAADSLDSVRAAVPKDPSEYFVGVAQRRPPSPLPEKPKSRRRGGF
ncbi:hypothetical protein [Neorhizobium sp. R1-B]|uniref:hypothetical protein n=1 Tax=Neorhizobium sp. R1-B TaxID=2485162 RepID=UPI0010669CE3|nr:hypothetical protein [Neorhizobium sp. R1-B]